MKGINYLIVVLILFMPYGADAKEDDHIARDVVIQSVAPNKLNVGGREFKTMHNPRGIGVFVYDPRTRFNGVKRNLIWLVLEGIAYPLNGPSKMITPKLMWPRDASPELWAQTGLSSYSATEAIELVFKK